MDDLIRRTADILRINDARWQGLSELHRSALARQPQPGEWSALECLAHAADTEATVFAARVRAILGGQPSFLNYDPDVEGTPVTNETDPVALAAALAAARADSLVVLASLRSEDLSRTARHSELGMVSLRELLNEWSAHDLMHLVQAERAVMQAFIEGTGPWRPYFAEHDVVQAKA